MLIADHGVGWTINRFCCQLPTLLDGILRKSTMFTILTKDWAYLRVVISLDGCRELSI